MSTVRFITRIVVVAIACAVGTEWIGWASLPVVGLIYGVTDRRARARGTVAALGAVLGWLAILGIAAARGTDVRAVAVNMGGVFQVSSVTFALMTLIFAALLGGTAAVLGASVIDARSTKLPKPD